MWLSASLVSASASYSKAPVFDLGRDRLFSLLASTLFARHSPSANVMLVMSRLQANCDPLLCKCEAAADVSLLAVYTLYVIIVAGRSIPAAAK
jgi:hypothetical protein